LVILAFTIIAALTIVAIFSYPLKVPHVLTIGVLSTAILRLYFPHKSYVIPTLVQYFIRCVGIVIAICSIYVATIKITAERELKTYFEAPQKQYNPKELEQLFLKVNHQGYSKFHLGRNLYRQKHIKKGLAYMDKAIQELPLPSFCNELTQYYLKQNNYSRAEELLRFSIGNEPFRFKPKMDLAHLYELTLQHKKAFDLYTKVQNLPIKIPSKTADNYKQIAADFIANYKSLHSSNSKTVAAIKGSLSINQIIYSGQFKREISYKIYLPKTAAITKNIPVIYIVDGQQYLEETQIVKQTDKLIEIGKIQSTALVFIDSRNTEDLSVNHRYEYLICNPKTLRFFEEELLPTLEKKYPITKDFPMVRTLYKKGYLLKVNQVEGADHNWELWKNEIEDILVYFYGKNPF